jgi:hypothetical protein
MTLLEFSDRNPWLAFFALLIVARCAFLVHNRTMRMLNVRAHGWPPSHLDADGDFRSDEDDEDEDA